MRVKKMSVECPALCLACSEHASSSCFLIIFKISQTVPNTHFLRLVFLNLANTFVCVIIFLLRIFTFPKAIQYLHFFAEPPALILDPCEHAQYPLLQHP